MGHKSYDLKNFIIISVIIHIITFVFFPISIFLWMDTPLPDETEQLAFYLVDYYDYIEIAQEEDDREEPETEIASMPTGNYEDLAIDLEEELLSEIQPEKDNIDDSQDLADESPDKASDEAIGKEEAVTETVVSDITPISIGDDLVISTDIEERQVIATELSDEFIDLPALTVPSAEDILEAFTEETTLASIDEDTPQQETEKSPTDYQNLEPELPDEPSLMVLQRVTPVYPKDAANEGIEGEVEFLIHVLESGKINTIEKLSSSGDQRIDSVAERTVLHGWQFLEMPKPYTIHLEISFSLQQVYLNFLDIFFTGDVL